MITPKQAYRMHKRLNAGLEDPMTEAMFAGEFVHQAFVDACHRVDTSPMEVEEMAYRYQMERYAKRTRFKDPARLQWREQYSLHRDIMRNSSHIVTIEEALHG